MGWGSKKKKIIKVVTWNKRRKQNKCVCGCGRQSLKGDFARASCSKNIVKEDTAEYRDMQARARKANNNRDIPRSIPPGQNRNGIVYDDQGRRVFEWDME